MSSRHALFKMEGACGKIVETDDPRVVKKIIYRRSKSQRRTKSLRARAQYEIQKWSHAECQLSRGYRVLKVPDAYKPEDHSFEMDRIVATNPLTQDEAQRDSMLMEDLRRFFVACKVRGLYPLDFELYTQPDGSIAMIDFDKFGRWCSDGSVVLPFGMTWSSEQVRANTWIY
jgi:hypothetical protein